MMLIAAVIIAAIFCCFVVMRFFETFTETVDTKEKKYRDMLAAELAAGVDAVTAIRKIHEREAPLVRNPNAKRLHNAAIERLMASVRAR